MKYESIKSAAIVLALDNGAINRWRGIVSFIDDLQRYLDTVSEDKLERINEWLGSLTEEQVETFVSGTDEEIAVLAETAPEGADELFDAIFEGVL